MWVQLPPPAIISSHILLSIFQCIPSVKLLKILNEFKLEIRVFIYIYEYGKVYIIIMMKEIIKNSRCGMTVLEVITVVVIIGIVTASSWFILKGMGTHLLVSDASVNFKQSVSLARQLALEKNKPYLVRCFPDSTPQLWKIVRVDSAGYFTPVRRDTLHRSIRFGKGSDISGSPNGPDGNPIPSDGVSFPANALAIMPRTGVPQPGAVYFTDGKETRAVYVSAIGTAEVMKYEGGSWH